MEKVEEILAEAVGKANAAEEAVEKAVTISEMIAMDESTSVASMVHSDRALQQLGVFRCGNVRGEG